MMRNACYAALCPFICSLLVLSPEAFAEITILESPHYVFNTSGYLRTDMIMLKNNIDLDSKNKDDSSTYAGLDYGVAFDLKLKDNGPEFYLKFERNGPFDYDAPIFIHNTLMTSSGPVERYRGEELFPHVEEFYYDVPLPFFSLRFKNGLYTYEVGNGLALTGYTENYGLTLYNKSENIQWRFYYCYPDIANGIRLGPFVEQEKEQGIMYDHSKANFFAGDITFTAERYTIQPYVGVLIDRTGDRRNNYFLAPTHKDLLGTLGVDSNLTLEKLSLGLELARNFGKAESEDPLYDDIKHT
ncbi:MAG: hypothetical protein PHV55_09615, partial [Candidatus Omnitrophica bacterium]|nr:hypothetical protein [Candidatus Omnitrophota bacterium]